MGGGGGGGFGAYPNALFRGWGIISNLTKHYVPGVGKFDKIPQKSLVPSSAILKIIQKYMQAQISDSHAIANKMFPMAQYLFTSVVC